MMEWTEEVISFRKDAAAYNGMEKQLADVIKKYIPQGVRVCDAGCGLGYLSLELAKSGYCVTAVDANEDALRVLKQNIEMQKDFQGVQSNINIVQTDIFQTRPAEKYEAMVFSSFGRTTEILKLIKEQCAGTGIIIKRNWNKHRFTTADAPHKESSYAKTCEELTTLGMTYETETVTVETGQPFRSLESAARFFELHNKNAGLHDLMDETEKTIMNVIALKGNDTVNAETSEFSYFFSSRQEMGIIVLEAGDLPETI